MIILAADTSCDESCIAIIDTEKMALLSDIVHSHTAQMQKWGGIVPEVASREHLKALPLALDEALTQAKLTLNQIDWFVVTHRPGLIGALLVGVTFIKSLAYSLNKPFTGLNHIEAHLYSPLLAHTQSEGPKPPPFPWIALVVSGGHTELFHVKDIGSYTWLGGTLDDAAGEAFDKVGKLIGLPYPQGPKIDKLVREKAQNHHFKIPFPRAKVGPHQFSFSGFKTSVALKAKELSPLSEENQLAIAASAQEAILDPLIDNLKAAAQELKTSQLVITGGVACNSRFRAKIPEAYFPLPKHCTDNAAMVAILAAFRQKSGLLTPSPWTMTAAASMDG